MVYITQFLATLWLTLLNPIPNASISSSSIHYSPSPPTLTTNIWALTNLGLPDHIQSPNSVDRSEIFIIAETDNLVIIPMEAPTTTSPQSSSQLPPLTDKLVITYPVTSRPNPKKK
jgi:hypothetical protein